MKRWWRQVWVGAACWAVALCLAGCGPASTPDAPTGKSLDLVTAIAPMGYLLERVGGGWATVTVLVPPGQAAETWQVLPRQMEAFSRAQCYFLLGLPFEKALAEQLPGACPLLRIVDLRGGVPLLSMEIHDHDHGSPGDQESHGPGDMDPHIWLDPLRMKLVVPSICKVLTEVDPAHGSQYEANAQALMRDLDALHARLKALLEPLHGRAFYVFHPAFGYLADRYSLQQIAVEAAGKSPGARRVNELADSMKAAKVRQLFAQPQFSRTEVDALARALDAEVVLLDDLHPDYLANLESIARAIAEGAV